MEPTRTETYKKIGDLELRAHIYAPEGHSSAAPRPAVLFFHGGGWGGGTPDQFDAHAKRLAALGLVAITLEYRLRSVHGTSPVECVNDAKSAMRWAYANANRLGLDPARIGAGGGSAGGHLAAATAALPGLNDPNDDLAICCRPAALVLFNPVADNGPTGFGHECVQQALADHPDAAGFAPSERYRAISPQHNIGPGFPPTIYFLGDNDRLIPVATAEAFRDAVLAAGSICELHVYEGPAHGFFNHRTDPETGGLNPYYTRTMAATEAFLQRLGWL